MKKVEALAWTGGFLVAATFIGVPIVANALEGPKPVVACAGQGQIQEGRGFISGAEDANNRYGLGLNRSELFDLGTGLDSRAGERPHPNQWVWVGAAADGNIVELNLGQCPEELPQPAPLPTASVQATPQG